MYVIKIPKTKQEQKKNNKAKELLKNIGGIINRYKLWRKQSMMYSVCAQDAILGYI